MRAFSNAVNVMVEEILSKDVNGEMSGEPKFGAAHRQWQIEIPNASMQ